MSKQIKIALYSSAVIGVLLLVFIYGISSVKTDVVVEAGSTFNASTVWSGFTPPALKICTEVDTSLVGYTECKAKVFGFLEVSINVLVDDTVAPKVAVKEVSTNYGTKVDPAKYVLSYIDATVGSYVYVTEPDYNKLGTQDVIICATDQGGNSVNVAAKLTVRQITDALIVEVGGKVPDVSEFILVGEAEVSYVNVPDASITSKLGRNEIKLVVNGKVTDSAIVVVDTTPPVIETDSIEVALNTNVSYKKNIVVKDNYYDASFIEIQIENKEVNLTKVGGYNITCTAIDGSGNTAKKQIVVYVTDTSSSNLSKEEIEKQADEVLKMIIKDGMTPRDKAYAIYEYTRNNISYKVNYAKGDWLQGAYDGLVNKYGDCFTFCATARILLTRAGIENSVIKKEITAETSQTNHYWNIVNLGDGWYHFDTTPRVDKTTFFMWTDSELKRYSDAHKGSHNFTRALYPTLK